MTKCRFVSDDVSFFKYVPFYNNQKKNILNNENTLPIIVDIFDTSEEEPHNQAEEVYFRKKWRNDPPQSQTLPQSDSSRKISLT